MRVSYEMESMAPNKYTQNKTCVVSYEMKSMVNKYTQNPKLCRGLIQHRVCMRSKNPRSVYPVWPAAKYVMVLGTSFVVHLVIICLAAENNLGRRKHTKVFFFTLEKYSMMWMLVITPPLSIGTCLFTLDFYLSVHPGLLMVYFYPWVAVHTT